MAVVDGTPSLSEPLLRAEAKYMSLGASISTVTFFRGDPAAATAALRERFAAVVAANPWLAGSLVKRKKVASLAYPATPPSVAVSRLFNPTALHRKKVKPLKLSASMSYFDLCVAVNGTAAEVPKGSKCFNKPEPLVALTVAADADRPNDSFAAIFSLSHVIADGFTYYRLLSMLSAGGTIEPLTPHRKHSIAAATVAAMGPKEHAFAYSPAFVMNIIGSMIFGSKPSITSHRIDAEKIEEAKAEATRGGAEGFVSTNDLLASAFGRLCGARVLLMPINFRGKLDGYDAADAGNYEGSLVLGPEDYRTAADVRAILRSGPPEYRRGGGGKPRPLPGGCEAARCKVAMLTNWTFDCFDELAIPGCEQLIHLPHSDVSGVPFDVCVVYRPRAKELAAVYFVRSTTPEQLATTQPVGESLQQ